jgi:5-methyltetrahydropteroyltriglutamate--homocysteine methyltransferase
LSDTRRDPLVLRGIRVHRAQEASMKVSDQDILLPTTLVGSYPRPAFMTGPVFGAGVKDKEFPSYRMREFYRDAVALAVKDMTDAGLDVVTDGAQLIRDELEGR